MNIASLINMIVRMVVNKGVNKGINHVSRGGKRTVDMTPAQRVAANSNRKNANRARQGLNLLRRFGRF